jgi:hypothetical protein
MVGHTIFHTVFRPPRWCHKAVGGIFCGVLRGNYVGKTIVGD